MISVINYTDGYKVDHRRQYQEGTTQVNSNFIPRKTRREGVDRIVFFGLQYFIKQYLIKEFNEWFRLPTEIAVRRYARRINNYLPPGHGVTFDHIKALHQLGYVPIKIKALPEGAKVPLKVAPITIVNTLPEFFWVVNYLETILSCTIWGPCTSATSAYEFRKMLESWAMKTVGNIDFVKYQGHDFSFRGMFGLEAAKMSGGAHLTSFVGTDTIPAIDWLEEFYNADSDKELVGCSVAATEHSVMCLSTGFYVWDRFKGDWNKLGEAEYLVFERLITETYPSGIVSVVGDTWNLWKVIHEYLPRLKEQILKRDGKLVIRPDSGDPVKIMTGYLDNECTYVNGNCHELIEVENSAYPVPGKMISNAEKIGVVEALWNIFGGTISEKGFKVLDTHIGSIYGDSINVDRGNEINDRLAKRGLASINWVAGIGSYTYQYVTRDTDGWAMKATYGEVQRRVGLGFVNPDKPVYETYNIDIFKDPITDDGTKKSARGMVRVDEAVAQTNYGPGLPKYRHIGYTMTDQVTKEEEAGGALKEVFVDGKLLIDWTLQQIRDRVTS